MSNVNQTIASLNSLGAEMSLLKHPFYQQWTAGTLSAERLRNYAIQYYPHVAAFPRYLSALHSRCDDFETRQVLLENLIDEERGAENHPELWLKFARALGVPRDEVLSAEQLPVANALVGTFDHLSRDLPLAAGLSALFVYESQVAQVATAKLDGLHRFYGFPQAVHDEHDAYERDARDATRAHSANAAHNSNAAHDAKVDGLKFFTVHRDADPIHAQAVADLIDRHAARPQDRAIALEAGRIALQAIWNLLDRL